ncbi:hypothetical protein HYH03_006708 [Edaphochlamys debaryana]|uniref:Uncharacterized protein n=1 Tax=Edaphochlamys debaryana TaxID=47281 RepID=A0A835Y4N0_9CHLO|nr:hypothetical protein HYH03_006708 [Edaphochlamys debaryana]|eukprot:KAG2495097.1 hypothetical protein HYH03_006708 [Edaphochlamys debaryana]
MATKAWSPEEEEAVLHAFIDNGPKWTEIARRVPGRTGVQVKSLWYCKLKHKTSRCASLLGNFARSYAALNNNGKNTSSKNHACACDKAYAEALALQDLDALSEGDGDSMYGGDYDDSTAADTPVSEAGFGMQPPWQQQVPAPGTGDGCGFAHATGGGDGMLAAADGGGKWAWGGSPFGQPQAATNGGDWAAPAARLGNMAPLERFGSNGANMAPLERFGSNGASMAAAASRAQWQPRGSGTGLAAAPNPDSFRQVDSARMGPEAPARKRTWTVATEGGDGIGAGGRWSSPGFNIGGAGGTALLHAVTPNASWGQQVRQQAAPLNLAPGPAPAFVGCSSIMAPGPPPPPQQQQQQQQPQPLAPSLQQPLQQLGLWGLGPTQPPARSSCPGFHRSSSTPRQPSLPLQPFPVAPSFVYVGDSPRRHGSRGRDAKPLSRMGGGAGGGGGGVTAAATWVEGGGDFSGAPPAAGDWGLLGSATAADGFARGCKVDSLMQEAARHSHDAWASESLPQGNAWSPPAQQQAPPAPQGFHPNAYDWAAGGTTPRAAARGWADPYPLTLPSASSQPQPQPQHRQWSYSPRRGALLAPSGGHQCASAVRGNLQPPGWQELGPQLRGPRQHEPMTAWQLQDSHSAPMACPGLQPQHPMEPGPGRSSVTAAPQRLLSCLPAGPGFERASAPALQGQQGPGGAVTRTEALAGSPSEDEPARQQSWVGTTATAQRACESPVRRWQESWANSHSQNVGLMDATRPLVNDGWLEPGGPFAVPDCPPAPHVDASTPGLWPSMGGPGEGEAPPPRRAYVPVAPTTSVGRPGPEVRRTPAAGFTLRAAWELWDDDCGEEEGSGVGDSQGNAEGGGLQRRESDAFWLDRAQDGEQEEYAGAPATGAPQRPSHWPGDLVDLCRAVRMPPPPDGLVPEGMRCLNMAAIRRMREDAAWRRS